MMPDPGRFGHHQPPGRAVRCVDRPETIVAATRDLLAAGNVPTMSGVATAAGVTRATLCAHFLI
jgi:AcrR family transcriptional regulator